MTILCNSVCKYLDDAKSLKDYPIELIKDMKICCVKIALYIAFYNFNIAYILKARKTEERYYYILYNRFYQFGIQKYI